MITAGIDIGSTTTKAVLLNQDLKIIGFSLKPTGANNRETAKNVFYETLNQSGIQREHVFKIYTTGYGRENIPFADKHITEITCHAMGIHSFFPAAKTIIDIGGQDTKGIQIDKAGKVQNFVMNDKCAAGTGRFLDVMARALNIKVDALTDLAQQSTKIVKISSMCTVFAESEVVSLVAKGVPASDIIKGIHDAVAERSTIMLKRLNVMEPIAMSGGVAKNKGLVLCLEAKLGAAIKIPELPQFIGAVGAATLAQSAKN
jgi:predicted CoA-substrate-specific enzyme activase